MSVFDIFFCLTSSISSPIISPSFCSSFLSACPHVVLITLCLLCTTDSRVLERVERQVASLTTAFTALVPAIVSLAAKDQNLWTKSVVSSTRDANFRGDLKRALGLHDTKKKKVLVPCMVSGHEGNGEQVLAAHIIPCAGDPRKLSYLGLTATDVSSTKNGLFLAEGIEKAFDKMELTFVRVSPLLDALHLHIWQDSCRGKPLWRGSLHTVGEFDGAELRLNGHVVYKRALCFHAYQCYLLHDPGGAGSVPPMSCSPGTYKYRSERQLYEDNFRRAVADELEGEEAGDCDSGV